MINKERKACLVLLQRAPSPDVMTMCLKEPVTDCCPCIVSVRLMLPSESLSNTCWISLKVRVALPNQQLDAEHSEMCVSQADITFGGWKRFANVS